MNMDWFSYVFIITASVIFLLTIALAVALATNKDIRNKFFGNNPDKKTPAEIVKYIGIIAGSVIVTATLYLSFASNDLSTREMIDSKFIQATHLLSSNDRHSNLTGVHTMYRLVEETKGHNYHEYYVKLIHDIFCYYIREMSEEKSAGVIQTIIGYLFKDEDNIFRKYELQSDLRGSIFNNISFDRLIIQNALLSNANFHNCVFTLTNLQKSDFREVYIRNSQFRSLNFEQVDFSGLTLDSCETNQPYQLPITLLEINDVRCNNVTIKDCKLQIGINNSLLDEINIKNTFFYDSEFINVGCGVSNLHNSGMSLQNVHFFNCNVIECTISNCTFDRVEYRSSWQYRSYGGRSSYIISKTSFNDITSNDCIVDDIFFENTSFSSSLYKDAEFNRCYYDGCEFNNTSFKFSEFSGCNFYSIISVESEFSHCFFGFTTHRYRSKPDEPDVLVYSFMRQNIINSFRSCLFKYPVINHCFYEYSELIDSEIISGQFEDINIRMSIISDSKFDKNWYNSNIGIENVFIDDSFFEVFTLPDCEIQEINIE